MPHAPTSLAKRLSLATSLSTVVLTLAALGLTLGLLIKTDNDRLHELGAQRLTFLVQSLENPLWSLDSATANAILEAVVQDQEVGLLLVNGASGEPLFRHDTGMELVYSQTQTVVHDGQEIGSVRLGMAASRRWGAIIALLPPAAGLMLLGIIVQTLTTNMVLRPMLERAFAGLNQMVSAFRAGDFSAKPPGKPDQEFTPLVQLLQDMAATIEAQMARLREAEEHLRDIFDGMSEAIFLQDPETGEVLQTNHRMQELFGYTEEEALQVSIGELSLEGTEYSSAAAMEHIRRAAAGDRHRFEWLSKDKHGRTFWTEVSLQAAMIGQNLRVLAAVRDITDRKNAEDELRQSEEKFSQLFHLSPEAITLIDMQTRTLVDANQAFTVLTGLERADVLGKELANLNFLPDVDRRRMLFDQLLNLGHAENFELRVQRKDGRSALCSLACTVLTLRGKPTILAMARDITELKRMQEMMVQTEKMISVGGIAAGIAHEINNPLGIVLQAAQNLTQRLKPDFPKNAEAAQNTSLDLEAMGRYIKARKIDLFLEDIQVAATRAASIIRHMLDFSRRSESRRCLCDIATIIGKGVELAGSDYDLKKSYDFKRIQIVRDIAPGLPGIHCTETEVEQVLLNLLRNAAQAMAAVVPPLEAPRIDIRATADENAVRIEVSDNGPGMTPEVQRRIFEPFFTTKPPGVGTGLGLSVSYFIITKGHKGNLTVSSNPGQGSQFTVELPIEGQLLEAGVQDKIPDS